MNLSKRISVILAFFLITMSTFSYATMTCNCTSGNMTVVHNGGTVSYSCSGGGQVSCVIQLQ
ncbi:hypothetical protein [Pseudoalteromonas porphyrae]|uniref:Secreted protein n=1 Tax=Pseudoalteromonas porphyrae TaxID=187330 RepID=A0A0N0LVT4_9GAMM|nr:hypothetical protein [Pseudoalteromonas porphyrae]KPH58628.1 hypothetical protein ADS77_17760 [Pseudoalteromonas porphyrae]